MWHGLTDVLKLRTARRPSQGPANTSCFLPGHPARRRTASSLPTGSSPRSVPGLSSDLGDSVLCCSFYNRNIPNDYDFLGLGSEFSQAPINDGTKPEEERVVSENSVGPIGYHSGKQ